MRLQSNIGLCEWKIKEKKYDSTVIKKYYQLIFDVRDFSFSLSSSCYFILSMFYIS